MFGGSDDKLHIYTIVECGFDMLCGQSIQIMIRQINAYFS